MPQHTLLPLNHPPPNAIVINAKVLPLRIDLEKTRRRNVLMNPPLRTRPMHVVMPAKHIYLRLGSSQNFPQLFLICKAIICLHVRHPRFQYGMMDENNVRIDTLMQSITKPLQLSLIDIAYSTIQEEQLDIFL